MRGTSDVSKAFGVKVGQDELPLEDAGMSRRKLCVAISNTCHCLIMVCGSLDLGSVFLMSIINNYPLRPGTTLARRVWVLSSSSTAT